MFNSIIEGNGKCLYLHNVAMGTRNPGKYDNNKAPSVDNQSIINYNYVN